MAVLDNNGRQDAAARDDGGGLPASASLAVLDASPWCVMLLDSGGRVLFCNKCAVEIFNFATRESATGADFFQLWPEAEREGMATRFAEALGGRVVHRTASCPDASHKTRWLEVTLAPISDAEGASSVICNLRDVTQQIAMQESLNNSQTRFRALADHMAQLAWMADRSGYIFWYNRRWFDYTGKSMAEMEGWGWASVQHPDHVNRVADKWLAHLRSGEIWEDVFPLLGADGQYRWFLSRAMPIRDAHGNIDLWCGTNTDITEERVATQRLRQKARLIELSHEAIFSWEMDGPILSWNRGCEELYGFSQDEALGADGRTLLSPQYPVPEHEKRDMLATDGNWAGEVLHYAKDGQKVWVDSRQELFKVGGKAIVLETNRDISERRKSDEIRSLLIGELNHRVKNTLAIVQSIAGQTARHCTNNKQFVASLQGRLQSLASAHNILTDSHWFGADLRKLIEAELGVTVGIDAHVSIVGDEVFLPPQTALQFTLILHELATNALKYGALSAGRGSVDISWRRSEQDPQKLEFTWREHGGPAVKEPDRVGFGVSLITRSGRLPNINTQISFKPDGVECRILASIQTDKDSEPDLFNLMRGETPLRMAPRQAVTRLSPTTPLRILIIEPEPLTALELEESLKESGYIPLGPATTPQSAFEAIARGNADAAVIDTSVFAPFYRQALEKLEEMKLAYVLISSGGRTADWPKNVPVLSKPVRGATLTMALASILADRPGLADRTNRQDKS